MFHSRSTKPAAKSPAIRTPYEVGLRVPTIAKLRCDNDATSPLTTNPIGIAARSLSETGQSGESGVINCAPTLSMRAAISSQFTSRSDCMIFPYLTLSYPDASNFLCTCAAPFVVISFDQKVCPPSITEKSASRARVSFKVQSLRVIGERVAHHLTAERNGHLNRPKSKPNGLSCAVHAQLDAPYLIHRAKNS